MTPEEMVAVVLDKYPGDERRQIGWMLGYSGSQPARLLNAIMLWLKQRDDTDETSK